MTRHDVYKLINGERGYQEERWAPRSTHGPGAYLTYMTRYLNQMIEIDSTVRSNSKEHFAARAAMRKFAALAVLCMEENGIVERGATYVTFDAAMGRASRTAVYCAIDAERDYQDSYGTALQRQHEFSEFLTILRYYLQLADEAWVTGPGNIGELKAVRKLAALAVRCMETHDSPGREPKWYDIELGTYPKPGEVVRGRDVFYDREHLCSWDGERRNDDGLPQLIATDTRGDDYYIRYWV
jgi:hypothetical protein